MGDISLADVARALDAMLDDQMTGQARIAAHLVAAAEAAGHGPERVIEALTAVVSSTVLAAFSEPDLLANARTSEYAEIGSVFEGLLGQQMIVQAALGGRFVAAAEAAGWARGEIEGRLQRIVRSSPIGEMDVAAMEGDVLYSSPTSPRPRAVADLPHAADLGPIRDGTIRVADHPTGSRAADGALWKYVTVADADRPRFVQVGLPIADSSPVSPRFGEARRA